MSARLKSATGARREAVNLRIRPETKALIDRAAELQGKSRSEFMVDASRQAAENVLLDQTFIKVSEKTFNEVLELLDRPPGPGFETLMNTPAPWET